MGYGDNRGLLAGAIAKAALLSVSYLAINVAAGGLSHAQTAQQSPASQSAPSQLPPVQIDEPTRKQRRQRSQPSNRAGAATARRRETPRSTPPAQASVWTTTYDTRTGTVGNYTNSTAIATKVNTPLINIPQSLTVLTKEFITDQGFQNLTDVTRYVPGVAVHQGEGNRDELVIRGVDSSQFFS